jgi:hypothetical protein
MKLYIVGELIDKVNVDITLDDWLDEDDQPIQVSKTITFTWDANIRGVLPVFTNKLAAQRYSKETGFPMYPINGKISKQIKEQDHA